MIIITITHLGIFFSILYLYMIIVGAKRIHKKNTSSVTKVKKLRLKQINSIGLIEIQSLHNYCQGNFLRFRFRKYNRRRFYKIIVKRKCLSRKM